MQFKDISRRITHYCIGNISSRFHRLGLTSPLVSALECEVSVLCSIHISGVCITWTDNMLWLGEHYGGVLFMSVRIWHLWGKHDLRIKALNKGNTICHQRDPSTAVKHTHTSKELSE